MKLIQVKPASVKGYLALTVLFGEGTKKFVIPETLYEELGAPARGETLDDDTVENVKQASEKFHATKRAFGILSYADNSKKQLTAKLVRQGFDKKTAVEVTREMVGRGYLDERRQLAPLVTREANAKLHGKHRILADLTAKGYAKDEILSEIQTQTQNGEIDFPANFKKLLQKKNVANDDFDQIKKWRYAYGYDRGDEE